MDLTPIIKINEKRQKSVCDPANKFFWGDTEKILFLSKVNKLDPKGGKKEFILLITLAQITIIKAKTKVKYEIERSINVISIVKVNYVEPELVTITAQDQNSQDQLFTFQAPELALDIAKTIVHIRTIFNYGTSIFPLKVESTPQTALVAPKFTQRPPNALRIRLIQYAKLYNYPDVLKDIQYLDEWDKKPTPLLKLGSVFNSSDNSNAATIYGSAISIDPDVKFIHFDNFLPQFSYKALKPIFERSETIVKATFENYRIQDADKQTFNLPSHPNTKLIDLIFRDCDPSYTFAVIQGLAKFNGKFKSLTLVKIPFPTETFQPLFDSFSRFTCFSQLFALRFEEGTANKLTYDVFEQFMPSLKMKNLSINKCTLDVSHLSKAILCQSQGIKVLTLQGNKLLAMPDPSLIFPESLNLLDLSRSSIKPSSFKSFLQILFAKPRKKLITLYMCNLINISKNESLVDCFNIPNTQPIVAEFNFSGNPLPPPELQKLINFLKTQKQLQYLSLSGCFKQQTNDCLRLLMGYVQEAHLEGLEIIQYGQDPPLGQFLTTFIRELNKRNVFLSRLNVERSQMGSPGLFELKVYSERNNRLTSLNCDGCFPDNLELFVNSYRSFSRIEFLAFPRMDIDKFRSSGQTNIPNIMPQKPPPIGLYQRMAEYELLEAYSGSSDFNPMDALADLIGKMSTTIIEKTNPRMQRRPSLTPEKNTQIADDNIFDKDIINICKQSIQTSYVDFKDHQDVPTKTCPLMLFLNPALGFEEDEDSLVQT